MKAAGISEVRERGKFLTRAEQGGLLFSNGEDLQRGNEDNYFRR